MSQILTSIMHGLLLGGAYGAIALGLSVIFGVTRITNFAHGGMLMASMYAYYALNRAFGLDPYVAIIIVAPIMYCVGYLIQKVLIKPLLARERANVIDPPTVMLMTIGLNFAINNLYMMIYGANYKTITTKAGSEYFEIGDALFVTQWAKVIAFFASFVLAIVLWLIINKTELGKRIRAVSQNRDASSLCGVDVSKTNSIAFGIGVATVSVAGACLCQFYFIQPTVGSIFGTKSFMMVVLGGLGSIPGAMLGGMIFGLVETVGAQFIPSSSASMLSFLLFILVLVFKPSGLVGKAKVK